MTAYQEFTGKSVEEALRNAREEFNVGLDELTGAELQPAGETLMQLGTFRSKREAVDAAVAEAHVQGAIVAEALRASIAVVDATVADAVRKAALMLEKAGAIVETAARPAFSFGRCTAIRQTFAARVERVSGWLPAGITSTNGSFA